ncbi:hypothetical protein [Mesorhizobium sp. LSJC264A00]|uniref:hypothetical protein n=1 Tax=Mesorhizobium sp. LSJC264A00 TaxID=1287321 RepID=UPI0003CF3B93|nr:hypothetical protein [Mesorhizobium sp. LSJC264A00]ESX08560.1 hypothetical protein X767_33260 [Mesorhizobium sp. LSJC264A00]
MKPRRIRHQFLLEPELSEKLETAQERFDKFVEQVGRQIASGKRSLGYGNGNGGEG